MKTPSSISGKIRVVLSVAVIALMSACATTDLDDSQISVEDGVIYLKAQEAIASSGEPEEIRIGATQDKETLWLDIAIDTVLTPKAIKFISDGRQDRLDVAAASASYDIIGTSTEWTYFNVAMPLSVLNDWVDSQDLKVVIVTEKGNFTRDFSYEVNPELREYLRALAKKLK